jgi:ferrochelatase
MQYDALLVVSFGGPEGPDDVIPFLENVLRGKNVPRERMLQVAEHYYHFGGKSPINDQNRALISALERELKEHGIDLPIYWGNRNWHPMLADTVRRMQTDGIRRALAFATSALGSYSGCRQYLEDIERAQVEVGAGAPEIDKLRTFHNHPRFIEAMAYRVRTALDSIPAGARDAAAVVYTAHSIPLSMAEASPYVQQLTESIRLVSESLGRTPGPLVYQSRSGAPGQPWLEPDICEYLRAQHAKGCLSDAVIVPIGFLSDHMEVVYDLDTEAAHVCQELGIHLVRAGTAGGHPAFLSMIRELILERTSDSERRALGILGAGPDVCAEGCCPTPRRPARPPAPAGSTRA